MEHEYRERPARKALLIRLKYLQNVTNFHNSKITIPTTTKKPRRYHIFTIKKPSSAPHFSRQPPVKTTIPRTRFFSCKMAPMRQ
jgi:hypothetical protein